MNLKSIEVVDNGYRYYVISGKKLLICEAPSNDDSNGKDAKDKDGVENKDGTDAKDGIVKKDDNQGKKDKDDNKNKTDLIQHDESLILYGNITGLGKELKITKSQALFENARLLQRLRELKEQRQLLELDFGNGFDISTISEQTLSTNRSTEEQIQAKCKSAGHNKLSNAAETHKQNKNEQQSYNGGSTALKIIKTTEKSVTCSSGDYLSTLGVPIKNKLKHGDGASTDVFTSPLQESQFVNFRTADPSRQLSEGSSCVCKVSPVEVKPRNADAEEIDLQKEINLRFTIVEGETGLYELKRVCSATSSLTRLQKQMNSVAFLSKAMLLALVRKLFLHPYYWISCLPDNIKASLLLLIIMVGVVLTIFIDLGDIFDAVHDLIFGIIVTGKAGLPWYRFW